MKRRNIVVLSVVAGLALVVPVMWKSRMSLINVAAFMLNTARSANAQAGALTLEVREAPTLVTTPAPPSGDVAGNNPADWPSYNRTAASNRFSPLVQINSDNAKNLKVLCTYDTKVRESFETGPVVIDGTLIGTTMNDTFSLDANTCKENWRVHEAFSPLTPLTVNRGVAHLDGRLFRGTLDGRVIAYDFKTGKRLWETVIADPKKGELIDAAPIASSGLVFIGIAGGDNKGVKGRMYALAADSGKITWETFLVPKTAKDPIRGPQGEMPAGASSTWANATNPKLPISGGGFWTSFTLDAANGDLYVPAGNPSPDFEDDARKGTNLFTNSVVTLNMKTGNYIRHVQITTKDWHDWDVSNTPALVTTRGGSRVLAFAPKDGNLYSYDASSGALRFRSPVTRMENVQVATNSTRPVHFCPGSVGGGEWNGVAYDPGTNLLLTGEDEWCTSIQLHKDAIKRVESAPGGIPWTGIVVSNPLDFAGKQDPHSQWAGWLYATDADSGEWKWRLKSNYPILSGVTTTASGLVMFGDMGGNFYVVNTRTGQRLWSTKLQGGIGGGVVSYAAKGNQRIAVATGLTSILWPVEPATAKIVIFGL